MEHAGFTNKTDSKTSYQREGRMKGIYSPGIDFLPFEHISTI